MKFGIANNVRSEVRECTPELFNRTLDSPQVARTCAEIEDALEACRHGELTQDEFETLKAQLKKRLPIFTFHATFKNGRRKNDDAIPSGLSIYDLDHIANPRAKWAEIEARKEELGILLSHISPSLEGLRLVFIIPLGMSLEQAQAWMARQIGDKEYDACVKDHARCSFAVPREYVLFMDADALFSLNSPQSTQSFTEDSLNVTQSDAPLNDKKENRSSSYPFAPVILSEAKNLGNTQEDAKEDALEILRRDAPLDDKKESRQNDKKESPQNDKNDGVQKKNNKNNGSDQI